MFRNDAGALEIEKAGACVAVDESSVFYSVGPERDVEACRAADGSPLWDCEILADNDPSNRVDWLVAQGDILLARLSNCWTKMGGVVMIDISTGALMKRVEWCTRNPFGMIKVAIFSADFFGWVSDGLENRVVRLQARRSETADYFRKGIKGWIRKKNTYYYFGEPSSIQVWQPECHGHSRFGSLLLDGEPLRVAGEFSRICVGKQLAAGIRARRGQPAKWCNVVQIFRDGDLEPEHRLPYGRLCCLSAFASKMVRIDIPIKPQGLAQSLFVQITSFIRGLCSPRRKPLRESPQTSKHEGSVFKQETHAQAHGDEIDSLADTHGTSVVQEVDHKEVAAIIEPAEANDIVHEQWATSRVEHDLPQLTIQTTKDIVVLALTKHSN